MKTKTSANAILFLSSMLCAGHAASAQEAPSSLDSLTRAVSKNRSDIEALKNVKISGFIQSQFQWADSSGIKSVAGGDFPANTDKRFKVRRAEFKTMYDNGKTTIIANIDITQNGIVIKDAFGKFTEQKLKAFSLASGIFSRPFGYEVGYSSGLLESPERARVIQVIFPGERDLGAMLSFQMPVSSPLHPLKVEGGMFNGTGNNANDFDSQKDFIGNIHWGEKLKSEKISYNAGVSYYRGGWANATKYVYSDSRYITGFQADSTPSNFNAITKREYLGADAQLNIEMPFGLTALRGEYISGRQPGTSSSTGSPSASPASSSSFVTVTVNNTPGTFTANVANPKAVDTYIRDFNGGYFYFLQNIMKTKHQIVLKYDWYNPNIHARGAQIGVAGSKLGAADLIYKTYGFGWIFHYDNNVKISAYYDHVLNETSSNLSGFTKDLKDDVFTLRVQYKF